MLAVMGQIPHEIEASSRVVLRQGHESRWMSSGNAYAMHLYGTLIAKLDTRDW
jgi:hypothetical protein